MAVMKPLLLLLLLAVAAYSQMSPIWSETPRMDTGNKILVNNHLSTTGTYNWSTSYHLNKTFSNNPWVGLCNPAFIPAIRQLRIASNSGNIGFHSFITGSPTMLSFMHMVNTYAPTEIWYLQVCYIAYDGSFQQFTDIDLTYKLFTNADINILDNSPGTFRTENLDTGMTVTAGNTIRIAAFTAGFRGTINNTYFQANVTEQIVGTNIQLSITIHPDTVINQISFYIIRADITSLLTRCWIFAQTGISRASYGAQYTFFTPSKVNYVTNYISGLHSFSLINNIQYNFTVSGLNFTTYSNSFYNDVSHFNLWVRICPSPYTLFSQVNFLCYTACPAGTYLESADSICKPCFYTCATCTDSTTCVTCAANRVLDGSYNCNCMDYFYEHNSVCVACHYSCKQCTHSGQFFNCMACDSAMHRVMGAATNSTCLCMAGYIDYGNTLCDEICGDGKVYIDPCDDGNLANDDGCSSTCQREQYFSCDNPTPPAVTPASQCYFVGNITVKVARIEKDPNQNLATFYLKVQPLVPKFKDLTVDNMVTNLESAKFAGFSFDGQYIKYNITYSVSFEGSTMVFGLKPSSTGTFSRFFPQNDTFVALASNGLHLHAYSRTDYTDAESLGVAATIIGYVFSAFAIIFCFGDWKQIGLQLFFSLQLCFMTFVVQIYHHPYITRMLYVRSVMGWSGELAQKIPPYHTVPVLQHLGYSVAFQYNFNIMAIFPGVALILYLAYRGALYRHERLRLEGKTNKQFEQLIQGKILKHFKFELFVYWMLFNMQEILMGTVIQSQYIENGAIYVFIVVCLIGIVVSIVGLFIRPGSTPAFREKLFHKSYGNKTFLMVLVATLVIDLLMLLAVLVNRAIFYASFACPLVVGAYVIGRRPFRLLWNNFRLFIIQLCLIAVIAMQVATFSTDYSIHKSFPLGVLICMGIIMLVTLITLIYDIAKKIWKLTRKDDYQESSKYESQKEEQSINEKVREAGYALVHGNANASRLPTVYEMGKTPSSSRRPMKSNVQPLRSPQQKNMRNKMKQPYDEKMNTTRLKSKLNNKQEEANKKAKDYEELRRDTEQKTDRPSTRRPRINPYTQILNETANKIK